MVAKIAVKALPVVEIIKDLAQQWQVRIEENSGELTVFLPAALGKGYVRGSSFNSGLGVIQYKCTFYKDYEIHFSKMDIHPLKFIFCSEGLIQHSFQDDKRLNTINTNQSVIVSSKGSKGHVLFLKPDRYVM